ncbi:MAG: hypothetical protein ACYSR9_15360 [Planctomycetota bacterium]|jgi:hypothetical protein
MEFGLPIEHYPPIFLVILISLIILMSLIVLIIKILIYCKIFSKAGYNWALGLLMFVPIANIIMPFVLAFGEWPIQKKLRLLKQQH